MADGLTDAAEVGSSSELTELQKTVTQLRRQLARVEATADRTVTVLVRAGTAVVGVLLLAAVFTPIVQIEIKRRVESYAMLRVVGAGFSAKTEDGGPDGAGVFFAVAFLVLVIVVLTAIVSLLAVAGRRGSQRQASWRTAIAVILLLGTGGTWLTSLLESGRSWWQVQPGLVLLTVGSVMFGALMFSSRFADWWVDAAPSKKHNSSVGPG